MFKPSTFVLSLETRLEHRMTNLLPCETNLIILTPLSPYLSAGPAQSSSTPRGSGAQHPQNSSIVNNTSTPAGK